MARVVPVPPQRRNRIFILVVQVLEILLERLGHVDCFLDMLFLDDNAASRVFFGFGFSERDSDLEGCWHNVSI